MRKIAFIFFLFLCESCGNDFDPPLFFVKGYSIYSEHEEIDREQIKYIINQLYSSLEENNFNLYSIKQTARRTSIYFKENPIECGKASKSGLCYALAYLNPDNIIFVWRHDECLGKTALVHELLHWIRDLIYYPQDDSPDYEHKDLLFFSSQQSIESKVKTNFIKNYCKE